MNIIVVKNYEEMSKKAAELIKKQITDNQKTILGLATGGTPIGMYAELIKMNQKQEIDFKEITAFNLDEYVGIKKEHPLSYYTYMNENLFSKINININNTFIPNGNGNIHNNANEYEIKIKEKGGIDFQLLGIGMNAHIGFNEPGSLKNSETNEVDLTQETIKANSRYFDSINDVPKKAISMGIGTILKAKKILLIASGENKAQAIYDMVKGEIGVNVPASFLQEHPDVTLVIDKDAAKKL